ncbi:MAG TPA: hypothetical protein VFS39_03320 [Nitrospira sp.]|nr:hypothetical protein [Nitrospira sp.]
MDLIVAVGLCATIVASGVLIMAANGMQIRTVGWESIGQPNGNLRGMDLLQPVLGQAIVDHALLERRHAKDAAAASTKLDGLALEGTQWQRAPYSYLDSIATGASWAEAEHTARVQTVMGRSIVNFTRRGVRSGLWSSVERAAHGTPHMIGVTEAVGQKMENAFLANWQPNLGRAIVAATQDSEKRSSLRQEQLGAAILQVATIQEAYEPARAAIQEQLGSATLAATVIGTQEGGITSDRVAADQAAVLNAQDAFPRISTTTIFIVASLILISLLTTGLFVFSPRRAAIPQADPVHRVPAALVPSKLL